MMVSNNRWVTLVERTVLIQRALVERTECHSGEDGFDSEGGSGVHMF